MFLGSACKSLERHRIENDRSRLEILAEMLEGRGPRNEEHGRRLVQQPGQRDLRRRRVEAPCRLLHRPSAQYRILGVKAESSGKYGTYGTASLRHASNKAWSERSATL